MKPTFNKIPLGYIELDNGAKAITPMNDLFLNYLFENPENWEALRNTVNIMLDEYKSRNPATKAALVTGKIKVETQYKYLSSASAIPKAQDIKMATDNELTYIEFHNYESHNSPVAVRSVEYFGLAIGRSKGKTANQIWFLAEKSESVLKGKIFARYILKDEETGESHPDDSGILYISLSKLAEENSIAGELAGFLLGKATDPKSEEVKKIAERFKTGFSTFSADKEVKMFLSLKDRGVMEGRVEGEAKGITKGIAKGLSAAADEFFELLAQGFTPEEARDKIKSKAYTEEKSLAE